jgi:hypothetical protein
MSKAVGAFREICPSSRPLIGCGWVGGVGREARDRMLITSGRPVRRSGCT